MIMSRLDFQPGMPNSNQLFEHGVAEPFEVACALDLLELRRKHYGDGVFAIDCGANVGIHTIEWSALMTGWGSVLAIEAQERLYYALAGNVAINNCFNVRAAHAAVAKTDGIMSIPSLNYYEPARYGSLELKQRNGTENIGQTINYDGTNTVQVRALRLDSLNPARVDLIKIDVEGMEIEVLEGGQQLLSRHKPLLIIEIIKSDHNAIFSFLNGLGYRISKLGRLDILAVHPTDKGFPEIAARDWSKETM
jgi:FkbM family methyltransferase